MGEGRVSREWKLQSRGEGMRRSDRCWMKFSDEPIGSYRAARGVYRKLLESMGSVPGGACPSHLDIKGLWCWQRSQSDFTGPTDKGRGLANQVTVL